MTDLGPSDKGESLKVAIEDLKHGHTDLNTFHAVMVILEGGTLYSSASKGAAKKIITICKREAYRCLTQHDKGLKVLTERVHVSR
jgi:hypothetical protein